MLTLFAALNLTTTVPFVVPVPLACQAMTANFPPPLLLNGSLVIEAGAGPSGPRDRRRADLAMLTRSASNCEWISEGPTTPGLRAYCRALASGQRCRPDSVQW